MGWRTSQVDQAGGRDGLTGRDSIVDINQKVVIDGVEIVGPSSGDAALNQCRSFDANTVNDKARPSITVTGTGIQIKVNLLNRCKDYWTYDHTIGSCNTGASSTSAETSSPATVTWLQTAQSYMITQCP